MEKDIKLNLQGHRKHYYKKPNLITGTLISYLSVVKYNEGFTLSKDIKFQVWHRIKFFFLFRLGRKYTIKLTNLTTTASSNTYYVSSLWTLNSIKFSTYQQQKQEQQQLLLQGWCKTDWTLCPHNLPPPDSPPWGRTCLTRDPGRTWSSTTCRRPWLRKRLGLSFLRSAK